MKLKRILSKVPLVLGTILFMSFILLPFYATIVGSLTPWAKIGMRHILPRYFHYQNYTYAWFKCNLPRFLANTFIYCVSTTLIVLIVAIFASYALSRLKVKGGKQFEFTILITQMVPISVLMISLFIFINTVGMLDTYISVIVIESAVLLAFPVVFLRGYFDEMPKELDDAALIDGCSRVGVLFRVLLPVAKPGIVAVIILVFALAWQRFVIPLILLFDTNKMPITVGIYRVYTMEEKPWQLLLAVSTIGIIPPLIIFFLAQKHIIKGLTSGAFKG